MMTTELTMLAWATVLGLLNVVITGPLTVAQFGAAYGLSSRDERKEATGIPARVNRALANFLQTFPFFAVAVLVAHVADRHSVWTVRGAELYFWARLLFLPCYAFNIIYARTACFLLAVAGIVMVLSALT